MESHVYRNEQAPLTQRHFAQHSDNTQDIEKNFQSPFPAATIQPGTTTLVATHDLIGRLGQTIKWQLLTDYRDLHVSLRAKKSSAFDDAMRNAQAVSQVIRDQMRRAELRPAIDALVELELRLKFRIIVECISDLDSLVVEIHRSRLQALQEWIHVLDGLQTIDGALPPASRLLPLPHLWGSSAQDCFDSWKARRKRDCPKTNDKYESIARAFSDVLGGVCVEYMQTQHVNLFLSHMRAIGNMDGTIANKMGIAKTLFGRVIISHDAQQALKDESPKIQKGTTGAACRDSFTKQQLTVLLDSVFNDRSLYADDRVAAALHALSGARLEEICALDASRIKWTGEYWLLDIVERGVSLTKAQAIAAKKSGDKGPKNQASVRQVPVIVSGIHGLHERLTKLKQIAGKDGKLFNHFTPNKYGMYGGAFSTRLNRRIDEVLGPDRRLVLESLRNTAAPTMRRAGVDPDERRVFMGHAPVDIHSAHYDRLHAEDLVKAATAVSDMVTEALEGIEFPRLDFIYSKQRRLLKTFDEDSMVLASEDQMDIGAETKPAPQASAHDYGQRNWQLNAAHGLDQNFGGNQPVTAPDVATTGVPGQGVMNVLRNACCTAESFERVPERVEDQPAVLDTTAITSPHVPAPPAREISASIAEPVGIQARKQPFVAGIPAGVRVTQETNALQFGVNRNCSIRRFGFDPGSDAVAHNRNQRAVLSVTHNVSYPQLTQFFEPRTRCEPKNRHPHRGLSCTTHIASIGNVDARAENRRQVLLVERQARKRRIAAGHRHPLGHVACQPAGIYSRLEHGRQMPQPLDDSGGRQASRNQVVTVGCDIAAGQLLHGYANNLIERSGSKLELSDRTHQPRRRQVAPIFEQAEHRLVSP